MPDLLPTELQLNIVSPDRLVVRDSVSAVTVPGKGGYIGVLPGHAPLLTELVPGELTYTREGMKHYLCVNWGFAEVSCMPPETALFNFALAVAAEWHAKMLQFNDALGCFAGKDFGCVLVDKVVAAFHGVEHVPFPAVFFLVA